MPEAQEGGPIALIKNGDIITIDAEKNIQRGRECREAEIAQRKAAWKMPPYKTTRGTL